MLLRLKRLQFGRREGRRQNAHECSAVERNFAAASHHMLPGIGPSSQISRRV